MTGSEDGDHLARGNPPPDGETAGPAHDLRPAPDTRVGSRRVLSRGVGGGTLSVTRQALTGFAEQAGLAGKQLYNFVLAVNELITNAVVHGGGAGRLRVWVSGRRLHCEVSDEGPGIPAERRAGRLPARDQMSGRGIWLVRRLCDDLTITTGRRGTTVHVSVPLHPTS
jgi:anti-sigma regulatory factor (Ser/Thr protein kinase)